MLKVEARQRRMIGHAALILLVAMGAGIGLLMSAIGGVELWPGVLMPVSVGASPASWARTHVGGILNALLIFALALVLPKLDFSEHALGRLSFIVIGTGWANTLFYWAAMFAPNRALTFGPNRFGASNLAALIGLAPALLFAVLSMIAVGAIAANALRQPAAASRR